MSNTRILAIDYGEKRIGLALSDPLKIIASPFKTIPNDEKKIQTLVKIIQDYNIDEIVLGCPFEHFENQISNPIIKKIYEFKQKLEEQTKIKITLWDEAFTSKEASRRLIEVIPKKMKRRDKSLIDIHAATILLEEYMKK